MIVNLIYFLLKKRKELEAEENRKETVTLRRDDFALKSRGKSNYFDEILSWNLVIMRKCVNF